LFVSLVLLAVAAKNAKNAKEDVALVAGHNKTKAISIL